MLTTFGPIAAGPIVSSVVGSGEAWELKKRPTAQRLSSLNDVDSQTSRHEPTVLGALVVHVQVDNILP